MEYQVLPTCILSASGGPTPGAGLSWKDYSLWRGLILEQFSAGAGWKCEEKELQRVQVTD